MAERTWTETMQVQAQDLAARVDGLIAEGNVRRIVLKHEGHTIFEIPLTAGVAVGAITVVVAPILAAVGAVAAFVTQSTLEIERAEETPDDDAAVPPPESHTATMVPPPQDARANGLPTHPAAEISRIRR